jgi:AbiV family abortive infection protein
MSVTVQTIIQNAERLLQDARLLAERGSHRTAIALAILSLEESGKACLVTWIKEGHLPSTEREAARHIDKQRIFVTSRIFKAIKSVYKVYKVDRGTAKGDHQARSWEKHLPTLTEAIETHVTVLRKTIEEGLLDHWKQAGFYVDIDDALNVVAPAIEFSEPWFDMFAADADEALQMAKSEPDAHELMAILYKAYKADSVILTPKERFKAIGVFAEHLKPYLRREDDNADA